MKTKKALLGGLIFIIMTACSSVPDDWEDGVLTIDFGQKSTSGIFYKIDIDGPTKKTYDRKSGDDNIEEKVRVGVYTISVIAYSDFVGGTIISEGSEKGVEVNAGAFTYVTIIPTNSPKAITAFKFSTTPESIGIIDEGTKTISVEVPFGTDVTKLTPSVTHTGKDYLPKEQQDFTNPVKYTVIATDDSMMYYSVTVTVRDLAQWAQSIQAAAGSTFNAVAVDSSGNVYAAGNTVLMKYNSSGTLLWAKSASTSSFDAVAVDSLGNVYAAGYCSGSGWVYYDSMGIGAYSAYDGSNAVLVKYNSDGAAQWARSTQAASNYSYFNAVAVDSLGNVYAAGYQYGDGQFSYGNSANNETVEGAFSDNNVVLVKYDSGGMAQWARSTMAGNASSVFNAVAVDSSGNVYAAGYQISGLFNYGNGVTATGAYNDNNVVLVKYGSGGDAQWARSTQAGTISGFRAVAVDNSGNVYAAGYQELSKLFNYGNGITVMGTYSGGARPGEGLRSVVMLVKYNSSGDAQWAQSALAAAYNRSSGFNAVTVDSSYNVYAAGYQAEGTFTYGSGVSATGLFSANSSVLVKYRE